MRRAAGQAGRLIHHLLQAAMGVVVIAACLAALLAWRLSQGPLELTPVIHTIEQAADRGGTTRLSIGSLSIAWAAFGAGVGVPLELRAADIAATSADGAKLAGVAHAAISVSIGALLLGRIVPRALEVDGARLSLTREADGRFSFDLGSLDGSSGPAAPAEDRGEGFEALLRELGRAPAGDAGARTWSQIRVVRMHDAAVTVIDRVISASVQVAPLDIDLLRKPQGGLEGTAHAVLALGDQTVDVAIEASGAPARSSVASFRLSPFNPARLAAQAPALAPLAALDATVSVSGEVDLGANLQPTLTLARVAVGAGTVRVGEGTSSLLDAMLNLEATRDHIEARLQPLELAARADGPKTTIQAHLDATRVNSGPERGRIVARLGVDLDQVAMGDLPALWPRGVGGPGTRPWITRNITEGTVRNARAAVELGVAADFSDLSVRSLAVAMDGRDLTIRWLPPVPPIDHVDGHLTMTSTSAIDMTVAAGHQAGGGLVLRNGRIHMTGIEQKDQFADIDGDVAGPLADLVTLLRHPRLGLLDKSPVPLHDVAGQVSGHLSFAHIPLKDSAALDDIAVKTRAHNTGVHLGGLIAGQDLDHGTLDTEATNDGMSVRGTATVAGIAAQLGFNMDFRGGAPGDVVEKATAVATVDERALDGLGLRTAGMLHGPVPMKVDAQFQRGGRGDVKLHADLDGALLQVNAIDWRKQPGTPATADATLVLDRDRIAGLDQFNLSGPGIDVAGSADFAGGKPSLVRLARVRFGANDVAGQVRLPARAGDPTGVSLSGASLDLSGYLGRNPSAPTEPKPRDDSPGPIFSLDARIARVILAGHSEATGFSAHLESDGRITRDAHIRGQIAGRSDFRIDIQPAAAGRNLTATAADAGTLLGAVGVLQDVVGGTLSVHGVWDDRSPAHPLSGTAELDGFRLRGVPALGKILQAMTLYGLVDAVTTGPGLNFSRLVAPFHFSGGVLTLTEARAFSSSLGLTARGDIDLDRRAAHVQGTVVPAYFFNTLLGNIPLIGQLFSPEKGGGVFAATYSVDGPFADPNVSVNALAALTPGFLRGLFNGLRPSEGVASNDPAPATGAK